jgi:hypothetical protein
MEKQLGRERLNFNQKNGNVLDFNLEKFSEKQNNCPVSPRGGVAGI